MISHKIARPHFYICATVATFLVCFVCVVWCSRVTLADGSQWLIHKGNNFGISSPTVVVDARHMGKKWKVKLSASPVAEPASPTDTWWPGHSGSLLLRWSKLTTSRGQRRFPSLLRTVTLTTTWSSPTAIMHRVIWCGREEEEPPINNSLVFFHCFKWKFHHQWRLANRNTLNLFLNQQLIKC